MKQWYMLYVLLGRHQWTGTESLFESVDRWWLLSTWSAATNLEEVWIKIKWKEMHLKMASATYLWFCSSLHLCNLVVRAPCAYSRYFSTLCLQILWCLSAPDTNTFNFLTRRHISRVFIIDIYSKRPLDIHQISRDLTAHWWPHDVTRRHWIA